MNANRIGIGLAIGVVALVLYQFVLIYKDRRLREDATAMIVGAEPYKSEVAKALHARTAVPPAGALPRHARAMSAQPDGTIVIESSDEIAAGGRVMLRPATNARGEVMWTCSAEKIRPALLPAPCRP